jgi:hypothetical protein
MKKFLSLMLALVLALGLAAPAMAFTSDDSAAEDHPYDLDIYLVEYEDNDFFGMISLPPSDRGYAKNEIVAAVVELYVPKDETILPEEYGISLFGGDYVSLHVTDNYDGGSLKLITTSNVKEGVNVRYPRRAQQRREIVLDVISWPARTRSKWLFFAKVTDDERIPVRQAHRRRGQQEYRRITSSKVSWTAKFTPLPSNGIGADSGY